VIVLLLSGELPQKVFSRHQRLSYAEITSYKCDESERWCALTGLTPQVMTMVVDDEGDVNDCLGKVSDGKFTEVLRHSQRKAL